LTRHFHLKLLVAAYVPAGSCSISGNLESKGNTPLYSHLIVIAVPVLATILHYGPFNIFWNLSWCMKSQKLCTYATSHAFRFLHSTVSQ